MYARWLVERVWKKLTSQASWTSCLVSCSLVWFGLCLFLFGVWLALLYCVLICFAFALFCFILLCFALFYFGLLDLFCFVMFSFVMFCFALFWFGLGCFGLNGKSSMFGIFFLWSCQTILSDFFLSDNIL